MPDYDDITNRYEKKHLQNIARTNERIREVFSDAIHTLTISAGRIRFNGEVFDLSKYPALKAQIEEVIQEMGGTIYTALVNSIEASWGLANEKNDILVDRRLAGKKPNAAGRSVLYDPNKQALEAFIKRKDKGLDLSKRVWNSLEPFKTELEKGLGLGIAEGKPAKAMATELKQFLNEPDKLFRRVRDAKGKLRLSKAAKEYHPGQGVYRSSFKNAARLTRTETNMAYRNADYERWQGLDFVTGIEVKLSNRHPEFDICDHVKGKYPKDFKFTGWHPQCLCHAVPLFATDEEYEKMEDAILAGEDTPKVKGIEDVPQGFKDYVKDNKERIEGWANRPYWAKDNPEYFAGKQPAKVVEMPKAEKPTFTPAKTVQEAKEYAIKKFGLTEDSRSLPIDSMNIINQRLTELMDEYPSTKLKRIETAKMGEYAKTTGVVLKFEQSYWSDLPKLQKAYNYGISTKWSADVPIEAIIDHEYAHVLTNSEILMSSPIAKEFETVRKEYIAKMKQIEKEGKDYREDADFISTYGNKDLYEFVAEGFALARNNPKAGVYAKKTFDIIQKHFKK